MKSKRRPQVSVIGDARVEARGARATHAYEVGRLLVTRGARVVTGGLGGVMTEAHRGARESSGYFEGATIAILPGYDPEKANEWADIVLPTGLGIARNLVVAQSDALIVIGGGAGTLSEVAFAWQLRRPIVALGSEGWSGELGGRRIDKRDRKTRIPEQDQIHVAKSPEEAVERALALIPEHTRIRGV